MFDSLLWDLYQQGQINETSRRVASVRQELSASEREMQRRIDKLTLINMALFSLLEEKLGLTQEQLADRVRDIDLSDGALDGRAAPPAIKCPRCSRVMSVRHKKCLYCGEADLTVNVHS